MPIARRSRFDNRADTVHDRIGGAGGAGCSASLDDGRAPLLDGSNKLAFEPVFVADCSGGWFAGDFGVEEVGVLG